jgi:hypothetical protein
MTKGIKVAKLYEWVPYFGLVCLLVLCYIATVHSAERKIREINAAHKEIEDIRREYITIKRDVQYEGTLYEVAKDVKGVNMNEEIRIPRKIEKI